MPPSTNLQTIRRKVRLITRSPNTDQLTDGQIDDYINTFVLYDMPEHDRYFKLHTTLRWICEPFADTYTSDDFPPGSDAEDFQQKFISFNGPVFIAGYQAQYSQSPGEFYNWFPNVRLIQAIPQQGNGVNLGPFSGTLNQTILRNYVMFSSVDVNNLGLSVTDDGNGNLVGDGVGTISYETGAYSFTFASAPKNQQNIDAQVLVYQPARPRALLYYDNTFVLRPVPDQPYEITIEGFRRPTEILSGFSPELEEWWQYIAFGAARKVFEDRGDVESEERIMPKFHEYRLLCLRRTIVQNSTQRTSTIYTPGLYGTGSGWWGNFGGNPGGGQ